MKKQDSQQGDEPGVTQTTMENKDLTPSDCTTTTDTRMLNLY